MYVYIKKINQRNLPPRYPSICFQPLLDLTMCHDALQTCQVSYTFHEVSEYCWPGRYASKYLKHTLTHTKGPESNKNIYHKRRPRQINEEIRLDKLSNLIMKGCFNLGGTDSPKKSASSAIFSKTLLTISPKYIPEINFSKICKQYHNK